MTAPMNNNDPEPFELRCPNCGQQMRMAPWLRRRSDNSVAFHLLICDDCQKTPRYYKG